jgi:hypothetical protein
MAGSSAVITSKEYSSGIKIVTIVFTADDTVAATIPTAALGAERGKELVGVFANGGTMTTNLDLSIVDSVTSRNLVATNGANAVDQGVATEITPETNSIVVGGLTVDIDVADENAVVDAVGTVWLVFKSKF